MRTKMEKMMLEEFYEKYMQNEKRWRFDLFKIVCRKCGSDLVEFDMELSGGWYGERADEDGGMVIKCHKCGNAFKTNFEDLLI